MGTRRAARPFDADDLADLNEREPEPLRSADEFEQPHRLRIACAVTRSRSFCRRQNAGRFVEAYRLPCGPAPRCEVADEQVCFAPWLGA